VEDLSFDLPRGKVTAIVGPNGCGKSTVLRALARLLKPDAGTILVDGGDITRTRTKDLARKMAILPQSATAPAGITVRELAGYGRFPHQGLLRSASAGDRAAIDWALDVTQMTGMQDREVDTLSGGERQRAWMAMALAQQTDILLLDEPTTYLDIRYQIDVLSLVRDINEQHGITVGWVLHDLNQAAAYSDKIVMLKDGQVVRDGHPADVLTPDSIRDVFDIECCVIQHPMGNVPVCLPNGFCGLQRANQCLARDNPRATSLMSAD
jgi:iron complex transport system ATP-binding protein